MHGTTAASAAASRVSRPTLGNVSSVDPAVTADAPGPHAQRPTHAAVAATILDVLAEVRWQHPETRVSCVARVGPFWQLIGSSQPLRCTPPSSKQVFEGQLAPLIAALDCPSGELLAPDAIRDPRTQDAPPPLLGDAPASFFVRLRDENVTSGFLRMDAKQVSGLGPAARESLHAAVPYAEVAVALERERAQADACRLSVEELADALTELRRQQRFASRELDRAVKSLRDLESKTFNAVKRQPELAEALRRAEAYVRSGFEAVSRDRLAAAVPRERR